MAQLDGLKGHASLFYMDMREAKGRGAARPKEEP